MFGTIIIMTDAAKGKAGRFLGIKRRFAENTRGFNVIRQSCVYFTIITISDDRFKLQLHDRIYRLRFYSNSFIHILSLSNSHNNAAPIQKNRDDKSHRVIVALGCVGALREQE